MSRFVKWMLVAAAILIGGALVYAFLQFYERRPVEVETGLRGEARRNPYLAAERFLSATGVPTRSVDALATLPAHDEVLVLLAPRRYFGPNRTRRLLEWVFTGGHLVVTPRLSFDVDDEDAADHFDEVVDDPILAAVDIRAVWIGIEPTSTAATTEFQFDDLREDTTHLARMNESYELIDDSRDAESYDDNSRRTRILHIDHGDGAITVLSGPQLFSNDHIGSADNAALLWNLVHRVQQPKSVWICRHDQFPGLLTLLWQHAAAAIGSGALLLLLWLIGHSRRFGPSLPPPDLDRRSLREHLDAAGRFLWRHKHASPLLAPLRAEVHRKVALRLPGAASRTDEELHRVLAARSDLSNSRVTRALTAAMITDARGFTQTVIDLVKLRNSL